MTNFPEELRAAAADSAHRPAARLDDAPSYAALEFRDTLDLLADDKIDATPAFVPTVALVGVETAFDALANRRARQDRHRPPNPRWPIARAL